MRLMRTVPNVRIEIMPGLGHYPGQENTADFIRIVQAFLAGIPV
jgi:pimeloyl-ACP methyl ester carboxylesterase